jgi:hypothetical protein
MATMSEAPEKTTIDTYHEYHAEAQALSGHLRRPVEQKIEPHVPVALKGRRSGHLYRFTEDVSIEGLITFKSAHSRVSGSKSSKKDPKHHGWVTLSTSILEGLNVFEVITADRIVSQVSTDHPEVDGHFPHVTFLGTQFDNLRVSGFPVTPTLNFGICGTKPDHDRSYLDDLKFLEMVKQQTERIADAGGLPKDMKEIYDERRAHVNQLIKNGGSNGSHEPKVICSLVTSIDKKIEESIPGVKVIGHLLVIPDFGTVSLGEIEVGEKNYELKDEKPKPEGPLRPGNYFELTIIKMKLGCIGAGTASGGTVSANGHHYP